MNQWKSAHAVGDQAAQPGRGARRRRRVLRAFGQGRGNAGDGARDGGPPDGRGHGQSRSRDHARGRARGARTMRSCAPAARTIPTRSTTSWAFPYIFRGALDVRASTINDAMKIAAAHALAKLAREDVPDEVAAAYSGQRLRYGPDYIVPTPFDPRLIWSVPPAVAKAAMDLGRGAPAVRRSRRLSRQPQGQARSHRRQPAAHLRSGPRQSASASSSPRARRRRPSAPRCRSATTVMARRC